MIRGYGADAIRQAEAPLLEAGEPLMLRAAAGLAAHVREVLPHLEHRRGPDDLHVAERTAGRTHGSETGRRSVLVLAGPGSNGGDGLHAAAYLRRAGVIVDALATGSSLHDGGADALRAAGGTIHCVRDLDEQAMGALLEGADLVLDAILGLGGRPEVPADLHRLLEAVRACGVPVIAVDQPSFLDATTGEAADLALSARSTVTFGAVTAGLLLPGGSALAGEVQLVELGLGPHLPPAPAVERLEDRDVRALWPVPDRDASKYTRGVVAIAAGSTRYPGAAVLACSGAARAGAGMVRCLAPAPVLDLVLRTRPEVLGHPVAGGLDLEQVGRTQALVVGPGLPSEDARARTCLQALTGGGSGPDRGVIDAGGLDALEPSDRFGPDVVLTPHRGEAERLARRLDLDADLPAPRLARELARATGATVLLKGVVTVIAPADPDEPLRAQDDATAYLATAGTGDVLAGILGALLAAGVRGPDAAAIAALLHGRAGRLASCGGVVPLVALEVVDRVPEALRAILEGAPCVSEGER